MEQPMDYTSAERREAARLFGAYFALDRINKAHSAYDVCGNAEAAPAR
jgi:hypothetical protein